MKQVLVEKKRIKNKPDISIPAKVLQDTTLSVLESIVEYLKADIGLSYREIGKLINRDERNIWTVYSRAMKKRRKR